MDQQTIIAISSAIFTAGSVYGMLNARLKNLEQHKVKHEDNGERLTRLEAKLDILLEHLIRD